MASNTRYDTCITIVEQCNASLHWQLDSATIGWYAERIDALAANQATPAHLSTIAQNFHNDHRTVTALFTPDAPGYDAAWMEYMRVVLVILRSRRLDWSQDPSFDHDDLAQIARAELLRSLPSFRYRSRFSVWVYQVVVRSVQRHLRASLALKRASRHESLELVAEDDLPSPLDQPELTANGQMLMRLIQRILANQPDQRLALIFQLWAIEDQRIADIGSRIQLHQSRVRALLSQTRRLLRDHPDIRAWAADDRSD